MCTWRTKYSKTSGAVHWLVSSTIYWILSWELAILFDHLTTVVTVRCGSVVKFSHQTTNIRYVLEYFSDPCTEVGFVRFLSKQFTTVAIVNPPDWKKVHLCAVVSIDLKNLNFLWVHDFIEITVKMLLIGIHWKTPISVSLVVEI